MSEILIIFGGISLSLICVWVYSRRRVSRIPKTLEEMTERILAKVDLGGFPELGEQWSNVYDNIEGQDNFRASVIRAAKAEYPDIMERTAANRMMVTRFMRDLMRERGMRPTHIVDNINVCVAIFFIPSMQQIQGLQVDATFSAHMREDEAKCDWFSFFHGFGGRLKYQSR